MALGNNGWSPRFWSNAKHAALRFESAQALDAAIDWLWSKPDLRDLPRVHVGENTMIVPTESVAAFLASGQRCSVSDVVSTGDVPPGVVNQARRTG